MHQGYGGSSIQRLPHIRALLRIAAAAGFEAEGGVPSRASVPTTAQPANNAATTTEVRSFFVTSTSRTPFLEWLTCARKLWFA
jgi:hypothetical protein